MRHPHCPRCGTPTHTARVEGRLRDRCDACERIWYDCAKPCATAVVEDDAGRVLLVRRGQAPYEGLWNLPGGFLEADEHPEHGARREALEETGYIVRLTGFLGAYVDKHEADGDETRAHHSLSLAYTGVIAGGQWRPCAESTAHGFFGPDELPGDAEIAYANHRATLADWRRLRLRGDARRPPFLLP